MNINYTNAIRQTVEETKRKQSQSIVCEHHWHHMVKSVCDSSWYQSQPWCTYKPEWPDWVSTYFWCCNLAFQASLDQGGRKAGAALILRPRCELGLSVRDVGRLRSGWSGDCVEPDPVTQWCHWQFNRPQARERQWKVWASKTFQHLPGVQLKNEPLWRCSTARFSLFCVSMFSGFLCFCALSLLLCSSFLFLCHLSFVLFSLIYF